MKYFNTPLRTFRRKVQGGENFHEISSFREEKQAVPEAALNNINITKPNEYIISYLLVNYETTSRICINRIIPH